MISGYYIKIENNQVLACKMITNEVIESLPFTDDWKNCKILEKKYQTGFYDWGPPLKIKFIAKELGDNNGITTRD